MDFEERSQRLGAIHQHTREVKLDGLFSDRNHTSDLPFFGHLNPIFGNTHKRILIRFRDRLEPVCALKPKAIGADPGKQIKDAKRSQAASPL